MPTVWDRFSSDAAVGAAVVDIGIASGGKPNLKSETVTVRVELSHSAYCCHASLHFTVYRIDFSYTMLSYCL